MDGDAQGWEKILLGGAGLLSLLLTWRGWRLGLVRQAVALVALGCGVGAGFLGGAFVGPWLRWMGVPDFLLTVPGGVLLGLAVYLTIVGVSAVLFKTTGDQGFGPVRWFYGAGGAVLGMVSALVLVWLGFEAIRFLGAVAQTQLEAGSAVAKTKRGRARLGPGHAFSESLVDMRASLDKGPLGGILKSLDPAPAGLEVILEKWGRMLASAESVQRFQGYGPVRVLAGNPMVKDLMEDAEVVRAFTQRDWMGLLRNGKVLRVLNDPEVGAALKAMDVEKALDYALSKPEKGEAPRRRP